MLGTVPSAFLALLAVLTLAVPAWAQYDPAKPEAADPHHIYVHPDEPGYDPNEPNDMPTPDRSQLYPPVSPAIQAKEEEVGAVINSPDFESTRQQWESALCMRVTMLGAVYMRDGSLVFQVGVESQGEPIPDVLPHIFMDLPVEVREMTIRPVNGVGRLRSNSPAPPNGQVPGRDH